MTIAEVPGRRRTHPLRLLRDRFAASNYLVILPLGYAVQMLIDMWQKFEALRGITAHPDATTNYLPWHAAGLIAAHQPARLYDLGVQSAVQHDLGGTAHAVVVFAYPPVVAWLFEPLNGLSLYAGAVAFMVFSAVLLAVAAVMILRLVPAEWPWYHRYLAVAVVLGFPAVENLGDLAFGAVELVAVAAGLLLLRSRRDLAAGLVFSLLLLKFQFAWPLPVLFVLAGRRRALAGFVAGGAAWLLACVALMPLSGFAALPGALHALAKAPSDAPTAVITMAGFSENAALAAAVVLAAAGTALMVRLRREMTADADFGVAVALAVGLLASPHSFQYDAVLLVPALLVWIRRDHAGGLLGAIAVGLITATPRPTGLLLLAFAVVVVSVVIRRAPVSGGPIEVRGAETVPA